MGSAVPFPFLSPRTKQSTVTNEQESRLKIERCEPEDAEAFLRLEAACFEMSYREEVLYFWRPVLDYGWVFRAKYGGKIVGGVIALPTRQGMVYVNSLFVHPRFRNHGIARRLLRRVLRLHPPKGFVLDVKTEKPYLVAFYKKEGFGVTRREENYYGDGSDRVILMRRALEG